MLSLKIFLKNKKYFTSAFQYACFSLLFSTWVTYIPYVADKLSITEGKIGGAIFFAALGGFVIVPVVNRVINHVGVGRLAYFSFIFLCFAFLGPLMVTNYTFLCIALFLFGIAASCFGISINSLTATIEKQDKVYIMSGSHGFFSAGGMVGAATSSYIAALIHNPLIHALGLIILLFIFQNWLRVQFYSIRGETILKEKRGKVNFKPLILIASIGLIVMVSEGAIADWSALYLKKIIHQDLKYIGMGYAAFSLSMTIGRFIGDFLSKKIGSWQMITSSSLLSIIGFVLVLIIHPVIPFAGFFIIGLGFSVIVPEVYRIASNIEGIKTSEGISFIAATSNIGYLVGPVFLGFLAELRSLHFSFLVLTCFVALVFIISFKRIKFK